MTIDSTATLDELQRLHGREGRVTFSRGPLGEVVDLAAPGGTARIALQGAQLLSWVPAGEAEVIWLSPEARPQPGKSLRGGAPVCWPWFGPHAEDERKPAHGFVRGAPWELLDTEATAQATRARLGFDTAGRWRAMWPHEARAVLTVTLGDGLTLALETTNTGAETFQLCQALHTYFAVAHIAETSVHGLDGCAFIDKVGVEARRRQEGMVRFDGEVDRIYLDPPGEVVIRDKALGRRIVIGASGSRSAVVWNPWIEKAARLGDMGADGFRRMLCVETANAADDAVTLAPGARHVLEARYRVERV